ncbi:MAG: radical SAM protein [Candidatus Omnitrophota bacterium]|nr:radical SAM protein [Candidatus Omnitrophota bacterium]
MKDAFNNRLEREGKLNFCCLNITNRCMFKCKMCYMWKDAACPDSEAPTFDHWKQFIASFGRFTNGKSCISFTGGEVLMSDKTLELVFYATELGLDTLLNSNAYLIDEDKAKRIHGSGLKKINISLDSLNEDKHDFIRGTPGSYKRVMKAIEYLHKHAVNLYVHINTVIMESNLDDIVALTLWAVKDQRISSIHFQSVAQPFNDIPNDLWYEQKEGSLLWPKDRERIERIFDELIKLKEMYRDKINNPSAQFRIFKSYFNNPRNFVKKYECHMYNDLINVSHFGDIRICNDMPSIGNIKEEGFEMERLWYSPLADAVRENMRKCTKNCTFMVSCSYDEQEIYIK